MCLSCKSTLLARFSANLQNHSVERAFQGEGKDVLTQEHIKSLLKDYKYGGVVVLFPA